MPTTKRVPSSRPSLPIPRIPGATSSSAAARHIRIRRWCYSAGRPQSSCGLASAASGPFYCPNDRKVYIDLTELQQRHSGPRATLPQAYVIAHEIGHHIQNLLGDLQRVEQMKQRVGEAERTSYRCASNCRPIAMSGVWANHRKAGPFRGRRYRRSVECGRSVGDDTPQKHARGHVVPESLSTARRTTQTWFKRGLQSGDIKAWDTFG